MKIQLESPAELARLCRELREQGGLTQKELAKAIGVGSVQAISNAESELQPSRFGIRQQILSHFGKSVREVYIVEDIGLESA